MLIDPKMQEKINRVLRDFVDPMCPRKRFPNNVGIDANADPLHEDMKYTVCQEYYRSGYTIFTNPHLKGGGIPDILVIPSDGLEPFVVEIVNTEEMASIEKKRERYPLSIGRVVEV